MVRSNDIHVSHGSTYDDAYCDGCNNRDTSDQLGKDINVQVVRNYNLFSDYNDCNDVLDATQQEERNTKLIWTLKNLVDNNNINNTKLDDNASVF